MASFETIFFYLRTGLTERGLSAFCTGNFTLPLATISSSSSSAGTKEEQRVKFLKTVKQHDNTSIYFSGRKNWGGGGRGGGGLIEYILGRCGCGKIHGDKSLVEDAGFATIESFRFEDEDAI